MAALRFFVNDKRISTAVPLKDGTILQVYPVKKKYLNENAWRLSWESSNLAKPTLRVNKEIVYELQKNVSSTQISSPLPKTTSINLEDWDFKAVTTHTFPPGDYYIGDLCYVLGEEVYNTIYQGYDYEDGLYTKKNTNDSFLVGGTAYGDGLYEGSDGKEFAVDAGIIGICTQSCILKNEGGGQAYTFTEPVKCRFKDGIFKFVSGDTTLIINTASYDADEE